jgi:hypothetical protein
MPHVNSLCIPRATVATSNKYDICILAPCRLHWAVEASHFSTLSLLTLQNPSPDALLIGEQIDYAQWSWGAIFTFAPWLLESVSVAKFSEKENWGTKHICGVCFLHCTTRAGLRGLPYICYYLENKCIVFEFIELLPLQIAPAKKHAGIH